MTIYVNPAGVGTHRMNPDTACLGYPNATTTVDEATDVVTITANGRAEETDCYRAAVTKVRVTLSQPLGDRSLVDGRDGSSVLVVRESDLPTVPSPWMELGQQFSELDGTRWNVGYTRPGGPDLHFTIKRGVVEGTPLEQVMVGTRPGIVVAVGTAQHAVRWPVGDLSYDMTLMPTEGATKLARGGALRPGPTHLAIGRPVTTGLRS